MELLGEAKRCRAELEKLQAEVERTEEQSTSDEPKSEVNDLRQRLLRAYNELRAAEDREYNTQHQLKWWAWSASVKLIQWQLHAFYNFTSVHSHSGFKLMH